MLKSPGILIKALQTFIFLNVILFTVSAQTNVKSVHTIPPVKVTSVEGITEYRLSNGLRVLLFPDPSKPTITVNMTYLVGSRLEGYGETGMAHLLEHMVFKGSTKHPNIAKELTDHGASPNGTTWYDRTNYFETFIQSDENLKWALDLESDRMVNSFIAQKDLKSEFSVVRNEFEAGENNPGRILEERIFSTAYLWHNYGKSTIGSKEDIERVPIENLKAFYKKYYQPDNAVLMVTGKIDETKTLQYVNQYFGPIPKPTRKLQEAYTMEPVQDGERFVILRRVGDVQIVACAYHIPSGTHPDYASLDILADVLTNEPSGRLYKALVASQKATSEYGYLYSLKDPGIGIFSANVLQERSLDSAKNAMTSVFDSLVIKPVTSQEVERSRNALLKYFEDFYRNSENIGLQMSEFIAEGDWRMAFIYRDNLKKVTADDVNRVAKAYFKNSNRTIGVFIPDKTPDRATIPPTPDVAALVKDYKGNGALASAEIFDASPTNIIKRTKLGTIAGGGKYAILKKTTRANTVHVRINIPVGNESNLQNKATIFRMTSELLRRGTQKNTYQQLNDTLDLLQSQVSFVGFDHIIHADITSTKDKLSKVLQIVKEMLRQPSFPESEFKILQQDLIARTENQKSEPAYQALNLSDRLRNPYPKGHIDYVQTFDEKIEDIKNTKPDDIQNFYKDYFNSSGATVSIVGDCNDTTAIQQVTDILQNWTSQQPYQHIDRKYFDVPGSEQQINTPDKKNACYIVVLNLPMNDDNIEYPAVDMGNYILGGGFLNSRLAKRIRQKEGISYGVSSHAFVSTKDSSGNFMAYAIYNPENLDKLDKAFKEEINKLLKEGITAEELKAAKSGYLQSKQVDRSNDDYLTRQYAYDLMYNRDMSWDAKREKQINELTVQQVNAAMRKYIKPEKFIYVKAGDFEKKGF